MRPPRSPLWAFNIKHSPDTLVRPEMDLPNLQSEIDEMGILRAPNNGQEFSSLWINRPATTDQSAIIMPR